MVNVQHSLNRSLQSALVPRNLAKTTKREAVSDAPAPKPDTPAAESGSAADFRALFTSRSNPPTTVSAEPPKAQISVPTAQSVFGPNPWIQNPGGVAPNGVAYSYNPTYFATRATAEKLAQMYGGTVVEMNAITPYGPFQQNQPNEMIRFSNGNVVNAGILASYFDHGYSQEQIDKYIAAEISTIPG